MDLQVDVKMEILFQSLKPHVQRAEAAAGVLLSSRVNQWTLLVGSLPIAYIAGGGHQRIPFDARQMEEFWLTAAQTLLGFAMLSKVSLRRWEALALFLLFALQFPCPQREVRIGFAWLYGFIAIALLLRHRRELPSIARSFLPGRRNQAAK